jgi:uncharacterized RDD family membrane protein YckC
LYNPLSPPANLPLASLGRRSLAAVFDAGAVLCVWFSYAVRFGAEVTPGHWVVSGWSALLLLGGAGAYWVLPEWLFGKTLGKLLFDLRVVSLQGRPCSLTQSIKRNLLRSLDCVGFYLVGFVAANFSLYRQRLGDQWAHTVVIRERGPSVSPATNDAQGGGTPEVARVDPNPYPK